MVKTARQAGDRTTDQHVRHDGAYDGYDQELSDVEGLQDPQLVRGIEHDSHEEHLADVLYRGAEETATLGGVREEGSQRSRLSFTGIPQVGSYRQNSDNSRHDEQAKVQGAAEAAEQFVNSARKQCRMYPWLCFYL